MTRLRIHRLVAALLASVAFAGCTIGVGATAVPRCDRNGDEEQRISCVR